MQRDNLKKYNENPNRSDGRFFLVVKSSLACGREEGVVVDNSLILDE